MIKFLKELFAEELIYPPHRISNIRQINDVRYNLDVMKTVNEAKLFNRLQDVRVKVKSIPNVKTYIHKTKNP